jgi:hypothetical protein
MHWFRQTAQARISREVASLPQLQQFSLAELGLPERGAMLITHSAQQAARHFVLE